MVYYVDKIQDLETEIARLRSLRSSDKLKDLKEGDGEESEPTSFLEVDVPPRIGSFEQPVLVIEERVNNSVTLRINNADKNHHCKVLAGDKMVWHCVICR